jgi:glycine betaine catabolism B
MLKPIDDFLNQITMYRLVLYILIILLGIGCILGKIGVVPYSPLAIVFSSLLFVTVGYLSNFVFAKVFEASTNIESVYITSLILTLIIAPGTSLQSYLFITMSSILATFSKYVLTIHKKHLFNPAAISVTLIAIFAGPSANWWVGTRYFFPFVLLGGLLIIRKIKREDMAFSFIITAFVTVLFNGLLKGSNLSTQVRSLMLDSPFIFFAFIMLTEPLTSPPTKKWQILYGALVGFIFAPAIHIGSLYSTPELALVIGNLFSYWISPKEKLILNKIFTQQIAPDTYDLIFPLKENFDYQPGQYMEWTLPHDKPDSRGNRRYFTLASSPTEKNLRLGIKFNNPSSSFKTALLKDPPILVAAQRAGDFTLPKNPRQKLVFIAGGIGVTPFRSMLKYLTDKNDKRDIILFFSNHKAEDLIYQDVFTNAEKILATKVIYTLTDTSSPPPGWAGKVGRVDEKMIKSEVPDFKERLFYLSGPHAMVEGFKNILKSMGLPQNQIKEDYFPGF